MSESVLPAETSLDAIKRVRDAARCDDEGRVPSLLRFAERKTTNGMTLTNDQAALYYDLIAVAHYVYALEEVREEVLPLVAELERSRTTEEGLAEDLRIANERGDAWREIIKEDTVKLERVRELAKEFGDGVSPECSMFALWLCEVLGDEQ